MFPIDGREYRLLRLGLARAGCPCELEGTVENRAFGRAIVVVKNPKRLGYVEATGYFPSGVIAAGAIARTRLMEQGIPRAWAFVEAGSLEIRQDDQMTCAEFMCKLDAGLRARHELLCSLNQAPRILAVYPFENYCVYATGDKAYRQSFGVDPRGANVVMVGNPLQVSAGMEQWEPVGWADTGARRAVAPPPLGRPTFSTGGASSELITQVVRNWSDILEAVGMWQAYRKAQNKEPLPPAFAPVLLRNNKVATALVNAGVDPWDFAVWSASARYSKTKTVGGDHVSKGDFAYAPSDDPSTWKLPVHDASHARNALARLNQTKGIPSGAKAGVLQKIRKIAKKSGVEVSEKPTAGQNSWARKQIKSSDHSMDWGVVGKGKKLAAISGTV